ncbi:MAG: transketolase [Phycisphaerae bacterium]
MPLDPQLETKCIHTLRALAMDAVQQADSGHPGAPMAMAPVAYALFDGVLRHDPTDPAWPNRDRFVLSMGHASMLLYSILHLTGYDLTLDDLKRFRQLHAKCAGHPEFGLVPGVETTTGPLGQGAGNSVGMAIAGQWLARQFNRPDFPLFDYRVVALCSDGDMMEGLTSEAASLAGHLRLNNLVWIYDDNRITIDGPTSLAFSEDVGRRFEAYGWHVQHVGDVNDLTALRAALNQAMDVDDRPALIVARSHIGYGSPNKQDTSAAHGAPLGHDEIRAAKQAYGLNPDRTFDVPADVTDHLASQCAQRGGRLRAAWQDLFEAYAKAHPDLARQIQWMRTRDLPPEWDADLPVFKPDAKGLATRQSSGQALTRLARTIPWLFGGSADLAASNKTLVGDKSAFAAENRAGRNLNFGIREHAMGAIANGMSLCGMRPYTATFLVFSDYMRPAMRLAALMGQPVIYVFTHDSIGVGEDGPTHQPIEQLAALRAIPGLDVVRPADAKETAAAWRYALQTTDHPVALVLTRQALPTLPGSEPTPADGLMRGAYVLAEPKGRPDVILIGTGSEVHLCLGAGDVLTGQGLAVRVVSMPCQEQFDRQGRAYRQRVLDPAVTRRLAIEAGVSQGWSRYVGDAGTVLGIETFGTSAPAEEAMIEYGMTVDAIVQAVKRLG